MVREHDRPIGGEQRIELTMRHPVWVLLFVLQAHEVDHVDDPDLQVRQALAEDVGRGEDLERRNVTRTAEHDVRLPTLIVAGPRPDAGAAGRVQDGVGHREPVRAHLLAGHDHVHVVAAAQAVVGDRQEGVRIGRQVDADDFGLLVHHVVDEAGVLVAEAIVILSPDVAAQQVIERRDRSAPGNPTRRLQPLRVLVEHRVDDVDEGLVAVEQAVTAGQQIPFEPTLAGVLGENLEDTAVRCEVLIGR